MASSLVPGAIISERYRLERLIGEGGMGAVWSATHLITRKHVGLKFLKGAVISEALLRRFLREARAASAVNHPNVLAVHDVIQLPDGLPVMVMDLLHGESLAERLARARKIPLAELAQILVPVISAVGTAHAAGIVHRDLKPDNIFLHVRPDGEAVPKVLDFGIAKLSSKEGEAAATAHLTQTGALLGTPYYMSPEQVFGEKDLDQRADVWSMGVILYECLSGQRPVEGENYGQLFKAIATGSITPLEQVAPELPADVTRLVARMLSPDRAQRPEDLREAYDILSRYSSTRAISFGGAAPAQVITSSPDASTGPDLAFEATGVAPAGVPGAEVSAAGTFSRTSTAAGERLRVPTRRLWPAVAGGAVLLLGTIAGGAVWLRSRVPAAAASAEAPSDSSANAAVASAAAPPLVVPTTTERDAGPDAAAAKSQRDAGKASKPPPPRRHARTKPSAKRSAPVASASRPAATASSANTAGAQQKLPGSVVGKVPF